MMVYGFLLARHLGPQRYGYYTAGYSIMGLWSFTISLGMDTWFLQKGGIVSDPNKIIGEILKTKLFIFAVWAPAFILFYTLQDGPVTPLFLIICALDIWGDSNLITIIYGLNVRRDYSAITRVLLFSRLGRLGGAIALILSEVRLPEIFALIRLFFTILGLTVALYTYKPSLRGTILQRPWIPFVELAPFLLSEMLVQIYIAADMSLLSILSNSVQVGLYSPASSLISALFVIPNTIYLFLVPIYSKTITQHRCLPGKYVFLPLGGLVTLGALLSSGLIVGSRWFVPIILGNGFGETGNLLILLSPILLFKSLQFGLAAIIVGAGWQKYRIIPQFVSALTNVGINLMMIPLFGAAGAAIAYNISEVVLLVGYAIVVITKTHNIFKVSP